MPLAFPEKICEKPDQASPDFGYAALRFPEALAIQAFASNDASVGSSNSCKASACMKRKLLLRDLTAFGIPTPTNQAGSFTTSRKESKMNTGTGSLSPQERSQEAVRVAAQMFGQNPDWVTFFREMLGVDGVARRLFTTQEQWVDFEQSEEFNQIQTMVATLRARSGGSPESQEPTRVITVRLPKSLHEALRAEAHDHKTSMNKLCISKLLQVLAEAEAAAQPATSIHRQTTTTPAPQATATTGATTSSGTGGFTSSGYTSSSNGNSSTGGFRPSF